MPRVLFLTDEREDYLQDQVLYGLRQVLGRDCVDVPRKEVLYQNCRRPREDLYGRGFTLWKLLPDLELQRPEPTDPTLGDDFDIVLFGSITRQKDLFRRWMSSGAKNRNARIAFLDGRDKARLFLPALGRGPYLKRERNLLSKAFTRPISFSIPEAKVQADPPPKTRLFATHVQCDEAYRLAWVRENCTKDYAFEDEAAYYADLGSAHFGITMRKDGWECQRHYEIAANGCVPCFFELEKKSPLGAPFGLVDGLNCISFNSSSELDAKTRNSLEAGTYFALARGALDWAREHTCENVAAKLLEDLQNRPETR